MMNKIDYKLGQLLSEEFSVRQMRLPMYNHENQYYELPALYYHLVKDEKEQGDYERIRQSVGTFEGNLKWRSGPSFPSRKNYEIIPKIAREKMDEHFKVTQEANNFKNIVDEAMFKNVCDLAIEDIPQLYKHMKQTL